MQYEFIGVDSETTGINPIKNDIIELSLIRFSDNVQKTWLIKPINIDNIEADALRINGHKIEDLLHHTQYGKDNYREASQVIVEVENWLMESGTPAAQTCLVAQNCAFDKAMMEQMWIKCNAKDTFPFGRRYLDTMIIELFRDYISGEYAEGYSLNNLTKKYGVKNIKAHSAAADIAATKEVFEKQVEYFRKLLK